MILASFPGGRVRGAGRGAEVGEEQLRDLRGHLRPHVREVRRAAGGARLGRGVRRPDRIRMDQRGRHLAPRTVCKHMTYVSTAWFGNLVRRIVCGITHVDSKLI